MTYAGPPRDNEELFQRKARARRRFDGMMLIEKMQLAIELHRDMAQTFRPSGTARVSEAAGSCRSDPAPR